MKRLREQAVEILDELPDDKLLYAYEMLKGLKSLYTNDNNFSADETNQEDRVIAEKHVKKSLNQKKKNKCPE